MDLFHITQALKLTGYRKLEVSFLSFVFTSILISEKFCFYFGTI